MPERVVYLPIEAYKSRSTEYMSVRDGVYETCFADAGVRYHTIRPWNEVREIKQGIVVDYVTRSEWGFAQFTALLKMMAAGRLDPAKDVIYVEDFWTPGFEMLPYAQCLHFGYSQSRHVPVYSFCHAQSTDPHDFTAPMAYWMRNMEQAWANYQSAVMCASKEMISQWDAGHLPAGKLRLCGLSFSSRAMRRMFSVPEQADLPTNRPPSVMFSSRWDAEKNPHYFLHLVEHYSKHRPEVQFKVCTGLPNLTSNHGTAVADLYEAASRCKNLTIMTGLSKEDYFKELRQTKVQFNCASQDFVSYTLLDAMLNGCVPLYPRLLTFPDALNRSKRHLYDADFSRRSYVDLTDCVRKLDALLDSPWEDCSWVWKKYESSTLRKLNAMGFRDVEAPPLEVLNSMDVPTLQEALANNGRSY